MHPGPGHCETRSRAGRAVLCSHEHTAGHQSHDMHAMHAMLQQEEEHGV